MATLGDVTSARPALAAAVLLALPMLAACERPTPQITVFSGTTSVQTEARAFCFGEAEGGCTARESTRVPSLDVRPGNTVGISVDQEIGEKGWAVFVNDQQASRPTNDLYQRFQVGPQSFAENDRLLFSIRTGGGEEEGNGQWEVLLVADQ